jgi:hypothetical protein
MSFNAFPFAMLVATARDLLSAVSARDGVFARPAHPRVAVLGRLASGVRVLAGFVRRLLVLMALAMEHGLVDRVDRAKPLARPDGRSRTAAGPAQTGFVVLGPATVFSSAPSSVQPAFDWADHKARRGLAPPMPPPSPARLYALLDVLARIVKDPEPRARRLAFYLARRRHGIILGPILPSGCGSGRPERLAGHWGSQVRASHDAMAAAIITAGRNRPPPLPPPRRAGPEITCL